MKYLHRVMFVLFAVVTYFVFNGEAGARTRYHSHHHRHHHTVVDVPRVTETHYVYIEADKVSFPVTNATPVAYADTDITGLLRSVSVAYNPYAVPDDVPVYHRNVFVVPEQLERMAYAGPLFILGCMLIFTGIYKGYLDGEVSAVRILSFSHWSPTPEVVRATYRQWEASRSALQRSNFAVYVRKLFSRTVDGFVPSRRAVVGDGKELIQTLLSRLPKKYVSRFDIHS